MLQKHTEFVKKIEEGQYINKMRGGLGLEHSAGSGQH